MDGILERTQPGSSMPASCPVATLPGIALLPFLSSMRSQLIGTDEAGYGPNLGPLVVSATLWEVPGRRGACDLWELLADVVSQTGPVDGRLHVADSKQVYQPARGLAELERSVLALLAQLGDVPHTLRELRGVLTGWRSPDAADYAAPWYADDEVPLPLEVTGDEVAECAARLRTALAAARIELRAIRSDVMCEGRFNRLTDAAGSKGAVLTEATLAVAASLWQSRPELPTLVLCDKHGGRNRYAAVLSSLTPDGFVATHRESRDQSVYRVGAGEFRFEVRAERHLPVAVASMVSKYVREVSMVAFNTYWQRELPDLRPTKGYPGDASRFRAEIAVAQSRVGIADDVLWRKR